MEKRGLWDGAALCAFGVDAILWSGRNRNGRSSGVGAHGSVYSPGVQEEKHEQAKRDAVNDEDARVVLFHVAQEPAHHDVGKDARDDGGEEIRPRFGAQMRLAQNFEALVETGERDGGMDSKKLNRAALSRSRP